MGSLSVTEQSKNGTFMRASTVGDLAVLRYRKAFGHMLHQLAYSNVRVKYPPQVTIPKSATPHPTDNHVPLDNTSTPKCHAFCKCMQ